MKKTIALFCLLALGGNVYAGEEETQEKLKQAMSSEIRTTAEVARDKNRKPLETLKFFGLADDMRVLELLPGRGWYTKLLAPVLKEHGKLYEGLGTGQLAKLLEQPGFEAIEVLETEANIGQAPGGRLYRLSKFDFDTSDLDIVFTFRNYHNFDQTSRGFINSAAFDALKSGGIYAVIDHTRRHMQETTDENNRRIDPVLAIKEIEQAGFIFEDYSDLHYRYDDELRYEVGRKSVTGNTDRFTLKFRKP